MQAPAQIHRVAGVALPGLVIMALMLGQSPARGQANCRCFTKAEIITTCKDMKKRRGSLLVSRGIYGVRFQMTTQRNKILVPTHDRYNSGRNTKFHLTTIRELKCRLEWKVPQRRTGKILEYNRWAEWKIWKSSHGLHCAKDSYGRGSKAYFPPWEETKLKSSQQEACRAHMESALSELRR